MRLATGPDDPVYLSAGFMADPVVGRVYHEGRELALTPKARKVLFTLLENAGEVVGKEVLFGQVWPDAFVEDNTLVRTLSMLRKALHDCQPSLECVATIPGRGYRWTLPVERVVRAAFLAHGAEGPAPDLAHARVAATANHDQPLPVGRWPRRGRLVLAAAVATLAAATVVAVAVGPPGADPISPESRLWRLTSGGRLDADPAWSPDGQFIAYSSDTAGNSDIWVQAVSGGSPVQLTAEGADDSQPSWSPDGRQVAFRSLRDGGGLFVVPAAGGSVRRLTDVGERPQWSPDGTRILFFSRRGPDAGLHVVTGGGGSSRLVVPFRDGLSLESATWHPDGRLSYWVAERGRATLYTAPIGDEAAAIRSATTAAVQERMVSTGVTFGKFVWSKNGTALYLEGRAEGVQNIWKVVVEAKTLAWVGGPDRLSTSAAHDGQLTLSPDESRVAFSSRTTHTTVMSMPFDSTGGRITGPATPISPEGVDAAVLDVSPDGSELAYRLTRRSQDELWIRSLNRPHEDRLRAVEPSSTILQPRWSYDGTKLAYFRRPRSGDQPAAVMVMGADAGDRREFPTARRQDTVYDWTRSGRSLLVRCQGPGGANDLAICLLPLDGGPGPGGATTLLAHDASRQLFGARFSPDERWIAFVALRNSVSATVYVMSAAGGKWVPMTDQHGYVAKPRWGSDGRALFFLAEHRGALNVWAQRFDPAEGRAAGQPFQVTYFGSAAEAIPRARDTQLVVTRDRLVVPVSRSTGSIWVLENPVR